MQMEDGMALNNCILVLICTEFFKINNYEKFKISFIRN
jgi:hypothetical protein